MDAKVHELLNDQVKQELYSAYLYMAFADYYEEEGLDGFANWYMVQAQEELGHVLKFRTYLHDNNCKVTLGTIDAPAREFTSYIEPLEAGLEHEKYITDLINNIYAVANDANDFRTMQFLDFFIQEQAEEETTADDMVTKMKLFGSDSKALYDLDQEYATRVVSTTAASTTTPTTAA